MPLSEAAFAFQGFTNFPHLFLPTELSQRNHHAFALAAVRVSR